MLCIVILLIGIASALDFDNTLKYSENDLKISINNFYGLGNKIGEVKLKSHQTTNEIRYVIPGKNRVVMWYEFKDFKEIYVNGLGDPIFINMYNGKEFEKEYYFALAEYETVEVNEYENVCIPSQELNGTISESCTRKNIGSHMEEKIKKWNKLNSNNIPKIGNNEKITIGLVTDVSAGDYIDGIWKIAGKYITKHSTWSDGLNLNLDTYWDFNSTTDLLGRLNLTVNAGAGATLQTENALIPLSANFTTANNYTVNNNAIPATWFYPSDRNSTLNFWIRITTTQAQTPMHQRAGGDGWEIRLDGSNQLTFCDIHQLDCAAIGSDVLIEGEWEMVTITSNATHNCVYINASNEWCDDVWNFENASGNTFALGTGADGDFLGMIDELSTWMDRTLNPSEITDLWNGGNGLTKTRINEMSLDIALDSPTDNFNTTLKSYSFSANFNATLGGVVNGQINLTNATLYLWNEDKTLFNKNISFYSTHSGTANLALSNFNTESYQWNYFICAENDTSNICEFASQNRTFNVNVFSENSMGYNSSSYEMFNERFTLNMTYDSSSYSALNAKLIYGDDSHIAEKNGGGDNILFSSNLDVPIITVVPTNFTFYWQVQLTNGTGTYYYNSTKNNQSIDQTLFSRCNDTFSSEKIINYTFYNETDLSWINATVKATFFYWLGDGKQKKNYSLDSPDSNRSFEFCVNANKTYHINSTLRIESPAFSDRTFYINKEDYINNTLIHKFLYLLNEDVGTNIIIQVKSPGLIPIEGYYVTIEKYYPESGGYREIIKEKTDEYGQFVAKLIENEEKYKFTFRDPNGKIVKETNDMTIACRASICVLPFIIEDTTDDFEEFKNISNYDWSLDFNNNTNIFTFTWNDASSESATNWLKVERILWNGTTTICNTTSTASSGSLIYNVGDQEANYNAQVFRKIGSGAWRRISVLSIKVGNIFATYGKEGLIWSFFLLMTMLVLGYYYPPIGVGFYLFGSILLYFSKIIYINPAILFAELVIGIAFIVAFGGKRV